MRSTPVPWHEDLLHLGAHPLLDLGRLDVGAAVGQELVEVGRQAEPVAVALAGQVVAGRRQGPPAPSSTWPTSSSGSATARRTSGTVASARAWPPLDSKKIGRGHLAVQPGLLHGLLGFLVQADGVRILLAADVRGDGPLQRVSPSCSNRAERNSESSSGAVPRPMSGSRCAPLKPSLVGTRDPQGQQAQHAARLLEARQGLPLPLEDGQGHRVEGVARLERLAGLVDGEPARHLLAVVDHPLGVGRDRLAGVVVRHAVPLEQPAADDLAGLGLGRHDDRLAQRGRAAS